MKKLPQWEPSEKMVNVDNRDSRGKRVVVDQDGVRHAVPRLPYEHWCDGAGNVVQLVVATTRNIKEAADWRSYAGQAQSRAMKKGWFRWDDGYGAKEQVNPATWPARREEIRQKRVEAHRSQTEAFNRGFKTEQEKLLEMLRAGQSANQKDMNDALARLAEAMEGKKVKGKKGSDGSGEE